MKEKHEVRDILFETEMLRRKSIFPAWNELGLIAGQPRLLSKLYYNENITQKELADISMIEPATLSRALDRLEEMGYIVRNGNPGCRRSFLVSLTKVGRTIAEKVWEEFDKLEDCMFFGFNEDELDALYGFISRINHNLGD